MGCNEYAIERLEDVIQLDQRQRKQFLLDFAEWLNYMDTARSLVDEFSELGVTVSSKGMVWKDDGITGLTGVRFEQQPA